MGIPLKGRQATPAAQEQGSKTLRRMSLIGPHGLSYQRRESWKKLVPSISVSVLVHAVLLLILSWIYFDLPNHRLVESILSLVIADNAPETDSVEIVIDGKAEQTLEPGEMNLGMGDATSEIMIDSMAESADVEAAEPTLRDSEDSPAADRVSSVPAPSPVNPRTPAVKSSKATKSTANKVVYRKGIADEVEGQKADHFNGRTSKGKAALLKRMGGTDASEAAVARGLVWLKHHQLPDGSWNFYHLANSECNCSMPGRNGNNPYAATAMALMAFLGAGQTQEEGDYQQQIQQGLDFLVASGMKADKGIYYFGQVTGNQPYYTQGLVLIALSEALAMTGDPKLRPAVTGAVEFLAATQHSGGGWRYFPGQPGDTSVVAWDLMALKSAQFSRVPIPQKVFKGVDRFIETVGSMRGTNYAYTPERRDSPTMSMTAAGLLCRMYLDWEDNKGKLRGGIRILDQHGPDPNNMYYNYYATQVMHHWGGPEWDRWNEQMREHLIRTQVLDGHAHGSWDVADPHGYAGGRLYMTTLALLTLEVYYRHLPLYQKDRIEVPLIHEAADSRTP